uniref:Collagen-like protein n=1 Tax=Panagrolaimus davidi TaxID=227884 RepID=A0A914PAK8_9BILA
MSIITKNVNALYEENKNLSMIEIFSKNEVILDENLIFPGINLLINAIKISIPQKIIIDLSGKVGEKLEDVKDEEEKLPGENGKDGKDGTAGNSSGNLCILAQDFENMENLDIKLNGGSGSDGKNGENGVNGENVYFYQGEKGKPGGMGGKNGLGGEGGFKGNCSIFIDGKLINEKIKIEAKNGENGKSGDVGKSGESGMDGTDIAKTKKGFNFKKYGIRRKQKLDYYFTNEKVEDSIYVRSRDTNNFEHKCYVKIIPKEMTKVLQDQTKAKKEEDRKEESRAKKCEPMDLNDAKIKQQDLVNYHLISQGKNSFETTTKQEEIVVPNRLYEVNNVKSNDEDYVPRLKFEIEMITEEEIESKNKANK